MQLCCGREEQLRNCSARNRGCVWEVVLGLGLSVCRLKATALGVGQKFSLSICYFTDEEAAASWSDCLMV
jgi:hypothetical protein